MRFLSLSDFVNDPNSGSAGSILAVGGALERRGHEVEYRWREERPALLGQSGLHRLFELPRRQLARVAKCLSMEPYDVVTISQPYAYLVYERLARLHPRTLFLNRTHGWEARYDRAATRFRWVEQRGPLSVAKTRLAQRLTRTACARTARACGGLIAPSRPCADFVRSTYGLPAGKVTVIPYGAPEIASSATRATRGLGCARLLFVGSYIPRKGTRILEQVLPGLARRFPDSRVTFVTNREATAQVYATFGPAFGDRLEVLPWMPREELSPVYAEHDVFLFPSLFEGFGKTFLEAMAHGLCVAGFDEGGLGDVATSGREALYCAPGDAKGFERLLERCLREPTLPQAVGAAARVRARALTWDHNAAMTEELCVALLDGSAAAAGDRRVARA